MRSARTLAPSVSTLLITSHDCCDLVPTLRQLERRLRTISYRERERERKRGGGTRRKEAERGETVEEDVTEGRKQGRKGREGKTRMTVRNESIRKQILD